MILGFGIACTGSVSYTHLDVYKRQDVHFEGGSLEDAVNEGVRQGYVEGFLRKSVVGDPIDVYKRQI